MTPLSRHLFIRTAIVLSIAAGVATASYAKFPAARESLAFGLASIGAGAAVLSVIYLAASIRESVRSEQWNRTFTYPQRWSDERFNPARSTLRDIYALDRGPQEVVKTLEEDSEAERSAITLMNFLEEMGLAVQIQAVDGELLRLYFHSTVIRVWETFLPWIREARSKRGSRLFLNLELLYDSWKQRQSDRLD